MKKIILALTIFVGLAIGTTTGLILQRNNFIKSEYSALETNSGDNNSIIFENDNKENEFFEEEKNQLSIKSEYHQNVNDNAPGTNLEDFYDENDLIWEKIEYSEDTIEGSYYQIKGLKNKEVEKKINDKLKTSAITTAKNRYSLSEYKENKLKFKQYKMSSFSNVISVANIENNESYNYYDKNNTFENFDLNTGNELKVEDLFTKDAEILNIIRKSFYKTLGEDLIR